VRVEVAGLKAAQRGLLAADAAGHLALGEAQAAPARGQGVQQGTAVGHGLDAEGKPRVSLVFGVDQFLKGD
jgi:hypothetical protein